MHVMYLELRSDSANQSLELGAILGHLSEPGDVVCLVGSLGTGKTVIARGMARGLGYSGPVPSPTFTIIRTYPRVRFCHVDAFRLKDSDDLVAAGIDEYLSGDWLCAVEWADRVRDSLPENAITLEMEFGPNAGQRLVRLVVPPGRIETARAIESELKKL